MPVAAVVPAMPAFCTVFNCLVAPTRSFLCGNNIALLRCFLFFSGNSYFCVLVFIPVNVSMPDGEKPRSTKY